MEFEDNADTSCGARRAGLRIIWITNLAPPYRIPVWRAMARETQLTVGLLERAEQLARDFRANRGDDWRRQAVPRLSWREYFTLKLRNKEARYYFLLGRQAFVDVAKTDVVILGGWESPAYWQLLAWSKVCGKPIVGFYESTLSSQRMKAGPIMRARRMFFRSLDHVVVPGAAAAQAIAAMGVPSKKVTVGFNAIDLESFNISSSTPTRTGCGHRFLYVGRMIPLKNIDTILKSFASVATASDTLTLIGDGPERQHLEELARELAIAHQTRWLGYLNNNEIPRQMSATDTLILASKQEVWGMVVSEALAAGMQAVVTRNCGIASSIRDMQGVYIADKDASDLAEVMMRARSGFQGRIRCPEILRHTPERFAQDFVTASRAAIH